MVLLLCFWSFLYLTDVITIVVKELNEDSCDMQLEQNEDELAEFSFFGVNYSLTITSGYVIKVSADEYWNVQCYT